MRYDFKNTAIAIFVLAIEHCARNFTGVKQIWRANVMHIVATFFCSTNRKNDTFVAICFVCMYVLEQRVRDNF